MGKFSLYHQGILWQNMPASLPLRMEHQRQYKVTFVCPGFIQTNVQNALTADGSKQNIDDDITKKWDANKCFYKKI
jgi:hypothetical protein